MRAGFIFGPESIFTGSFCFAVLTFTCVPPISITSTFIYPPGEVIEIFRSEPPTQSSGPSTRKELWGIHQNPLQDFYLEPMPIMPYFSSRNVRGFGGRVVASSCQVTTLILHRSS